MTSDLYSVTKTTNPIAITIANECALTQLSLPSGPPTIADLEFTVGTSTSTQIALFAHD